MAEAEAPAAPRLYPLIAAQCPETSNRLWAIPFVGGLIKGLILVPQMVELAILALVAGVLTFCNSFVVLFTGSYWIPAYAAQIALLRLSAKVAFFWLGLTDRYPGFGFTIEDGLSADMPIPLRPSRFFAFPLLGGFVRWVIMIPFWLYAQVLQLAAFIAALVSSFAVLCVGRYPESTCELVRDWFRVSVGYGFYLAGLSDRYPTFSISINHAPIKILWLAIAVVATLLQIASSRGS